MGIFLAAALALGAFSALAADIPIYVGPVKGALLTSLTERVGFAFESGQPVGCTRTEASGLVVFRCRDVTGARATVTAKDGATKTLDFGGKLVVMYKTSKVFMDIIQEYHYEGTWRETTAGVELATPVQLTLWNLRLQPKEMHGFLKLADHGVYGSVAATQP